MMHLSQSFCLGLLLMVLVSPGSAMQKLMADKETIVKILSSGKLIQCSEAIDVLLLMDGSYSIGKGSFERSKRFATKLCDILDINPDRVRIGVIQFSTKPKLEFGLEIYSTKEEAKEAIKRIIFRGGSTEIGRAMKYVLRKGFHGARESAPKIIVILTDGKSQDNATLPLRLARNSGMTVFAVGIKHPSWEDLKSLASNPSELHVFYAENYDDAINGLFTTLTQSTVCSDIHPACRVVSQFCLRTTVDAEKEYHGKHVCWKSKKDGGKQHGKPMATFCPFYNWKRVFHRIQNRCHRTVCPDPCDSGPCLNGGTCIMETVDEYSCLCPLGYGGDKNCAGNKYLKPAAITDCTVDLLFLVDGSWNMGLEGFHQAKGFVKLLLQSIMASSAMVSVGFAQYSDSVRMEIGMGQYSTFSDLLKAIDWIRFKGGNTFTGRALQYVAEYGFKTSDGFRNSIPHVLMVLSNSKSRDSLIFPAQYAKEREILILSVGISSMINELIQIAGDTRMAFTFNGAQELHNKVLELRNKICGLNTPGCFSKSLDLVFAVDASNNVGRQNFRYIKGFVRNVISHFDIDRELTQVGMVIYSDKPRTLFNLDAFDSEGKMKRAINSAPFLHGNALTGKALQYILEDTLSIQRGVRPGVQKVVVLITNGQSTDNALAGAEHLRQNGIIIIAVGVGNAQSASLLRIAGNPKSMISLWSYEDVKHSEMNLVRKICESKW
ncbi:von Willebrand factor A domain-containing protein 2-like [Callorhinchus milii]|uniref:von Willebrand factor A domain-containing protein 2-like n=1 Tax=Callorhinchus milii TaxID=7868 RepID=UPI001C3F61B7|nr:von Willebrand factor A domain-containing protein 2-like [Callorhinchus milii]